MLLYAVCQIGACDVIDYENNIVTRHIDKIVLNGTEIWGWANESATTVRFYRPKNDSIKLASGYCDKFKHISSLPATTTEEGFSLTTTEGLIYVNINKTRLKGFTDSMSQAEKVNLFKLFLASNNVTVQYELATPAIEPIEIDKKDLYTYKTVTNITTDSAVQPKISASYTLDTQTYIKQENEKTKILFENLNGATGDIVLNDNVNNYQYLEIFYSNNDGIQSSQKVLSRENDIIALNNMMMEDNCLYVKYNRFIIRSNKLETTESIEWNSFQNSTVRIQHIYVKKIVGYK